ncbi:uncharacterized protein LOC114131186 [Aphis gossypii]|uniref:Uncharacterized protein n=1 Tax=Aphis gossypii TaxID=80765 RepID=A0A9P0IRN8_APHGO|nr:uncharacterized protein LOC114131186 [Aphis gossypii]CAH1713650.1 unnamed protein product [Aphis gossypii]
MRFLFKICVLSIILKCIVSELQCLSLNKNVDKCQDWKNMSVLVADLVGRSIVDNKVETKSNMLTLLIRAASGAIGHGTNALKTLIVNGLVLLTQIVLTVSDYGTTNYRGTSQKNQIFPDGRPIDWIMNNPYIKSMMDDATDETLPDLLIEQLTSGMPCVQLLLCRLSPIIHYMQRQVKESSHSPPHKWLSWNMSYWQQVKGNAKHCVEKHNDCDKIIKLNSAK